MISAFNISTSVTDTSECTLFIQISNYEISYWALKPDYSCFALAVYHFTSGCTSEKAAENLKSIVAEQPLLQQSFQKVHCIHGFAEALLVPDRFMRGTDTNEMLDLVYGENGESTTRKDFVHQQNLHNIYRVPKQVDDVVSQLFPSALNWHSYSLLSATIPDNANQLYCIFGPNYLVAQLVKNGKLQIAQQFDYKKPEDAAYYLLSICEQFDATLTETDVLLHGMIDEQSNLYQEVYKYMPKVKFADLPATFVYEEGIKAYPSHYFSHLFEIASCA